MKKNSQGMVLPAILLIITALSILGLALLIRWDFDARAQKLAEDKLQAHYLARSGVEIAKNFLNDNYDVRKQMPFYLFGDLNDSADDGTFTFESDIDVDPSTYDHHNIVVTVLPTNPPSNTEGKLISQGRYNNAADVLSFNFKFPSTQIPEEGEPEIPVISDGVISASDPSIKWVNESGKINKGGTTDCQVIFGGKGEVIIVESNKGIELHAPSMHFVEKPTSLVVTQNKTLKLFADYITFHGDVQLNSTPHEAKLILKTHNSQLLADDILGNGDKTTHYGLVYFGGAVDLGATNLNITSENFYYFADGINLREYEPPSELLIPITDRSKIPLDKLGLNDGLGDISGTFQ